MRIFESDLRSLVILIVSKIAELFVINNGGLVATKIKYLVTTYIFSRDMQRDNIASTSLMAIASRS